MEELVSQIQEVFESFRMPVVHQIDEYTTKGKEKMATKIASFTQNNQPISFVMLGYPFKSLNERDKVLGKKPDLGELLSLRNFGTFNRQVKKVYKPGITMVLVSDGYTFNDVMGISPSVVAAYEEVCKDISRKEPIEWYDLTDFYRKGDPSYSKQKMLSQFAIDPTELERRIMMDVDVNSLYRGMIIFMEEELTINSYPSHNQLQKAAKKVAREAMFMNEAYSNLVKVEFDKSIRLSMHPSSNNEKYSFQLVPSKYARHSPWHSAIAISDNQVKTMHKKDAIAEGYEIVYENGQPYYFAKN